jgi:hypothetical protein
LIRQVFTQNVGGIPTESPLPEALVLLNNQWPSIVRSPMLGSEIDVLVVDVLQIVVVSLVAPKPGVVVENRRAPDAS